MGFGSGVGAIGCSSGCGFPNSFGSGCNYAVVWGVVIAIIVLLFVLFAGSFGFGI